MAHNLWLVTTLWIEQVRQSTEPCNINKCIGYVLSRELNGIEWYDIQLIVQYTLNEVTINGKISPNIFIELEQFVLTYHKR